MKKVIALIAALFFCEGNVMAQYALLPILHQCDAGSTPFSDVSTLDNRTDPQLLGYVHTGIANRYKAVKFEGSLADTLALFFKSKDPDSPKSRSLVLMLNELFIHESSSGAGKAKLSLRLFTEATQGRFAEFLTIDSIYQVKGFDVTQKLLHVIDKELCTISKSASAQNLDLIDRKPNYSLEELRNLDRIETAQLPMYVADKPVSGIYKDYDHFKRNDPDIKTDMIIDTSKPKNIKVQRVYKVKNRKFKFDDFTVYAISDGERIFKVVPAGEFFEIKKNEKGFYYDRRGSFAAQTNSMPYYPTGGGTVGMMFIIGDDYPGNTNSVYRFLINHRNGTSVPSTIVK